MIYDKVDYEINWIFMYSPLYVFFDILRFRKINALTLIKNLETVLAHRGCNLLPTSKDEKYTGRIKCYIFYTICDLLQCRPHVG